MIKIAWISTFLTGYVIGFFSGIGLIIYLLTKSSELRETLIKLIK